MLRKAKSCKLVEWKMKLQKPPGKGWEDWKHFEFTTPYDDWLLNIERGSAVKMETEAKPSQNDGPLERFPVLQMRLLATGSQRLPGVIQQVEAGLGPQPAEGSPPLPSFLPFF